MTLGTLLWIAIIGVVLFLMMKKGGGCCGSHGHDGHDHGEAGQHLAHKEQADPAKDPVCGMTVANISIASEHQGKTYYFCSENCQKAFEASPDKFGS